MIDKNMDSGNSWLPFVSKDLGLKSLEESDLLNPGLKPGVRASGASRAIGAY